MLGPNCNGKSTLLQDFSDSHGFHFATFDCLDFFNLKLLKSLFKDKIQGIS